MRCWPTPRSNVSPRLRGGAGLLHWMIARHGPPPTPALGTIKQLDYMVAEVERVKGAPGDEPSFRAYDMNEALSPVREMILSPDDLRACFVDELPARAGPAYLGFDFGEATSSTAATAIWPQTGRAEFWMSFGDVPPLADRQRRDSGSLRRDGGTRRAALLSRPRRAP